MAIVVLACAAWFWWLSTHNPQIDFLSQVSPAEWIVYPKPPEGMTHRSAEISAIFRRSFVLDKPPGEATVSLRALKHATISINDAAPAPAARTGANWKQPHHT